LILVGSILPKFLQGQFHTPMGGERGANTMVDKGIKMHLSFAEIPNFLQKKIAKNLATYLVFLRSSQILYASPHA
jgi:hypothetical protein